MSSFDAATKLHNKIGKSAFSDDDEENCESHDHQMYSLTRFQSTKNFTKNFIERGSKITIPVLLFTFLLLLLIWDMKMTSTLSEIIHDDHADRWEPMDSDGLNRWFSPIDVCMLKLDQENVDIRTYRAKNCSNLEGEQRLFCGIGSSLGKSCLSPLSNRSFFTSRLIGILGDPDNKILKQSLRLLAVEKKAVVFIGDVISKQNQEAMVCELMRTDRITFTGGPHSSQDSTLSEFGIKWKDHPHLSLKIIFMHLAHLTGVHEIRRHRRLSPRNLEGETEEKTILNSRPEAKDNSSIYSQGGPSMTLISASSQLDTILQNYPAGIVVIANIGVWYNSREKYRKELPLFLRWLNNLGETNGNIVMFRETAAQHWNHTGIFLGQLHNVFFFCVSTFQLLLTIDLH